MRKSQLARMLAVTSLFLASQLACAGEDEPPVEIGYYALTPSIVSNLSGGPKYIRCDIQLMTRHAADLPQAERHAPAIRHTVLMLLAGEDGKKLQTPDGKEALRKTALAAIRTQLKELTGKEIIDDLYFTAYYVK